MILDMRNSIEKVKYPSNMASTRIITSTLDGIYELTTPVIPHCLKTIVQIGHSHVWL